MKIISLALVVLALTTADSIFASDYLDVVEKAQKTIKEKYPDQDSIARKVALEELENIARSDKTNGQKIEAILKRFPDTPLTQIEKADLNSNGIPDEWEKEYKIKLENASADSDEDSDSFTLIQEYMAKTDPTDPLSHPKYISQVYVDAVSQQRFNGLELISVDMTENDKKDWQATFNVIRNNRKRAEFVRINIGTFKNNNVDFSVVDIKFDDKTQTPIVYIQRVGKVERIACRPKQAVYDPSPRVRFLNSLLGRTFISSVGAEFSLGTNNTGKEVYKVVSADPATKEVVVESIGEKSETFTLRPAPHDDDDSGMDDKSSFYQ